MFFLGGLFFIERLRRDARSFFLCFITHFRYKNDKKCKKCKKMQKNCKKICIYQKFVVILHRLSKMSERRNPKSKPKTN